MVSAYRAQFDYIVLKPIWFLVLCWAGVSFYNKAWLAGLLYLIMLLALGYVGARLHKSLSFKELAAGTPSLADASLRSDPTKLSYEDSRAVTSASLRVTFIIGIVASILAARAHG